MKGMEQNELLRLRWLAHHRHRQTWQLLGTKKLIRRSPDHTILRRARQTPRRGGRNSVGPHASRLANPIVSGSRPSPFAKTTGRIEHPRPNLLRLRVPAKSLAAFQKHFPLSNNLKLFQQEALVLVP